MYQQTIDKQSTKETAQSDTLRVLLVTNDYPTEAIPGESPCVRDQLQELQALGVDVDLLFINRHDKKEYFKAAWQVFKMNFQPKKYDLVHAHYGHSGLVARFQFRMPIVVTFRGSDLLGDLKERTIGQLAASQAAGIIVMTEEMKRTTRSDARVIPYGVNTRIFKPEDRAEARKKLGLPADKKLALFPWNPERPEKNFALIHQAVQLLKAEGTDVQVICMFDEQHERVAQHMNACDVMLLASHHEGSPVSIREAMACNLPIVSVDVGDVRDVITGTENCFICERSPEDMANRIAQVLESGERSNGAERMDEMSENAASQRVIEVYQRVLSQSARG